MPLQPPKLDDRDFNSLFQEVLSRIPRYLPEWTDWNTSDPGITLLQLHTWLAETILYRLNQLPDLNYLKFLQLLDIEQAPAEPAEAELTFALKETLEDEYISEVLIPKGTVVGSSERDLPQPVNFETNRTLRAITARLELLFTHNASDDNASIINVTQDNNTDRSFSPFGQPAEHESSLILGFRSSQPFPRKEIGIQIYLAEKGQELLAPPEESECGLEIATDGGPTLSWYWWDGNDWSSLNVRASDDGTRGLTRSGQVYFQVPGQIPQVRGVTLDPPVFPEDDENKSSYYWFRVKFASGRYVDVPEIVRVTTNTITATAALTVNDEVVGASDGSPNQILTLRHSPLLADPPLELEIDEGRGPMKWELVPNFHSAKPQNEYFTLNRSSGQISFGDGIHGRIPLAGQSNVIARSYRYGGGRIGNVGRETITDMVTTNANVEEVTNHRQAVGGEDEELLETTKVTGPRNLLKTQDRAVTLEDFSELARKTPGALVARASAYAADSNVINVVIVPRSRDAKPVPSEASRELVCQYLDKRRLITSRVRVMGPPYQDFRVAINAYAKDDADLLEVKNAISERLAEYFHPLQGGPDKGGWPFGRDVYYSELLHEIMSLEGVLLVDNLELRKFLPREKPEDESTDGQQYTPYFVTEEGADKVKAELRDKEVAAFSQITEGSEPTADTAIVVAEDATGARETRIYVVAVYKGCDMPVSDGALLALKQPLDITINYLRSRGPG